ncbi:DoxX family protein [Allorhizocola rhizosphaerae]|uniref:DoxX family protein n=1 Tax=Allorhizocola rhizosphaerae TaxID=1872709 RepID=UPI000E3D2801|nr:DoxX family protein [Allorhizocola rhizosphaerae]
MNVALWVVQALLALAFAGAGFLKVSKSRDELRPRMPYVADFSTGTVRLIGAVELLGAAGLILPWATGIAPVLTPLAATGLVIVMILAAFTHIRRSEPQGVVFNAILGALALFVAIGRF